MSDRYWIDHCIGIARDAGNIDSARDATNEIERLQAERDAAVAVLEAVLKIPDMSDADLEQLRINCKAAIDAARGEKP